MSRTYGIARGAYAKLYAAQDGRCYICQRATGRTRRLAVDHDHETMLVRGLLCGGCNKMLGHARDSTYFFRRAIEYLLNPPAQKVIYGPSTD